MTLVISVPIPDLTPMPLFTNDPLVFPLLTIGNNEQITQIALVFPLLTLNK